MGKIQSDSPAYRAITAGRKNTYLFGYVIGIMYQGYEWLYDTKGEPTISGKDADTTFNSRKSALTLATKLSTAETPFFVRGMKYITSNPEHAKNLLKWSDVPEELTAKMFV